MNSLQQLQVHIMLKIVINYVKMTHNVNHLMSSIILQMTINANYTTMESAHQFLLLTLSCTRSPTSMNYLMLEQPNVLTRAQRILIQLEFNFVKTKLMKLIVLLMVSTTQILLMTKNVVELLLELLLQLM
jgi:hypothetical protein